MTNEQRNEQRKERELILILTDVVAKIPKDKPQLFASLKIAYENIDGVSKLDYFVVDVFGIVNGEWVCVAYKIISLTNVNASIALLDFSDPQNKFYADYLAKEKGDNDDEV